MEMAGKQRACLHHSAGWSREECLPRIQTYRGLWSKIYVISEGQNTSSLNIILKWFQVLIDSNHVAEIKVVSSGGSYLQMKPQKIPMIK